jgi:Mn2+/Fe2+ NRAMP family transporter
MRNSPLDRLRRFFRSCGPGIVTGAADDDPAGIGTYSIAGARFGTAFLWTPLLTWPLTAFVEMSCARIGMVTGRGLMASLRGRFPRWLLILVSLALFLANTINIGADLAAMGEAGELFTPVPAGIWIVVLGVALAWATVEIPYHRIARVLKWLALVLFAYVVTAVLARPDWGVVLRAALVPRVPDGGEGWATFVAILGTTISPYLFFWQASEEVEEEKGQGRGAEARRGATPLELHERRLDVVSGTFFSNLVMFFIILTTALTLHPHGILRIETSAQAAHALEPLAGRFAALLYAVGVIGTGLLAIPTLTASAAYAMAEIFAWRQGLDQPFRHARAFYGVILVAMTGGIALHWAGVNPVRALFYSAVVNGVLAPVVLVGVLVVAGDRRAMRGQPSPVLARGVIGLAVLLMSAGVVIMLATM